MFLKKLWGDSTFDRYILVLLGAIELLMSFTSLGYIHMPPISITLVYLPILVAGCLFGPAQAVALGLLFGLTSMYKASASFVLPADAAFSPFSSGAPLNSLLLSIGTRAFFALVIGATFLLAKRWKGRRLWFGLISAFAPKIHSLIVYSAMGALFPELGYRYSSAFHWDMDDLIFSVACVVIVELFWSLYQSDRAQDIRFSVDQSIHDPYAPEQLRLYFTLFEAFILFTAILVMDYFSQRESFILKWHQVTVSPGILADMENLQLQFLVALLALNTISIILLMIMYKYMSYKKYRGELDELTGVMGRRMFLHHCGKTQKSAGQGQTGWFLFVDADYFKQINDTFGHAVGDQVLRSIASNLQAVFGGDGTVGRIGGDEFAVMVHEPLPEEELRRRLDRFLQTIAQTLSERRVSCSIGAYEFAFPQNVKDLLSKTDDMLYQAKERGRACYVTKAYLPQ